MSQLSLPKVSYTARRLEHSSAEHLYITSRRAFIGPIPEGWLKSHRKHWYKEHFSLGVSRRPSFRAAEATFDGQNDVQETRAPRQLEPRPEQEPHSNIAGNDRRHQDEQSRAQPVSSPDDSSGEIRATSTTSLLHTQHAASESVPAPSQATTDTSPPVDSDLNNTNSKPRVTFNESSKLQLRARARRLASRTGLKSASFKDGELLKMDKMLVRVDITQQHLNDYDERISQGVETRTLDKWREFMVVCRNHTEGDAKAILQLYQTRVITATEEKVKTKPKVQIMLSPRNVKVNMFSSLDKTLCVWTSNNARTTIYYLRPGSSATSVEWYTFLRSVMGWDRSKILQVNVPDLSLTLRLKDPFNTPDQQTISDAAKGDDQAIIKAISDEIGAAGSIVARCMTMLEGSAEWSDVFKIWQSGHIGLAWKRYDRLEWIHGSIEEKMYGTIAMAKTHDLELRPKDHYPTKIQDMVEPPPVEGFLIRLTTQTGHDRRLGKMLFKRLYFTTQNQYLMFMRPARAKPPPPPKMHVEENGHIPSAAAIAEQVPTIFDIEPYTIADGKLTWLNTHDAVQRDAAAEAEADRQAEMLLASDGFVDLCNVATVREMQQGASPADEHIEEGGDVDFDMSVPDHTGEDGTTQEVEEDRMFELVMKNGLVIRLQAFSKVTRNEWMKRLQELVKYWTRRVKDDLNLYKSVRQQNLQTLRIDERAEATVGQFAYKWEVSQSFASPQQYNVCGLSNCRAIHTSGLLFRKPRRHTTFTRCHVILSHGHLLIYQDTLRSRTGKTMVHIHHERISSIDLTDCYLYSGLLTENDLLYQNQTFDSNMPGHHALPRIYLEDGWTSTDEDAMTSFVIWHSKAKSWFRSSHTIDDAEDARKSVEIENSKGKTEKKLKRVGKLGATGRSVVFKARSRAERDHWVLAIQNEIERLSSVTTEDVRLEDVDS